jgi:type IV pilus assembly protein PilM
MRQIKLSLPAKRQRTRRLVGLDIEPGAIHVAEATHGPGGRLVVERSAMRALEPGVVRDGEIVDAEALSEALKSLWDEHGFDRRVRVGIANQRVVVRTMDLPPITDPKDLAQAVRFQAPAEVPIPLDQAVLDHVSLGVVETPNGPRTRVVLVAARRELIEKVLTVVTSAGLRPEGIDLSAFALVRSMAERTEEPVAYLSLGGTVNLAVGRGGHCLFTRVIGGGLETMAMELAERREEPVEHAREALLQAGMPVAVPVPEPDPIDEELAGIFVTPEPAPVDEASVILADGVRRIVSDVRASLDFHMGAELAGPDGPAKVARLVLTGAGMSMPGVADALAEQLMLPVETLGVDGTDDAGRYAVAAGLAVEEMAA